MKITESQLRNIIRSEIKKLREASTSATGTGAAKKSGYQSKGRKDAQSDYDTKSTDYDTKKKAHQTKSQEAIPLQYRSAPGKGGSYTYSATKLRGGDVNPAYTKYQSDLSSLKLQKDTANRARISSLTTLDTEKAADLKKTVPTQKPPRGGGAGFGKGKTAGKAGKGKGKKGKKGGDEEE
jgi:hypothetical protein